MPSERTAELTRKLYDAFEAGDVGLMQGLMAEDTIWHVAGSNLVSGTYSGVEEVFGFFAHVAELTNGTFRLDVHDIAASENLGMALVTAYATRHGREHRVRQVHVNRWEAGRLVEVWNFPEDHRAYEDLWS